MPVANKTTTNNKKQKSSLIQRLKLNTLKGRMLATVLVFALIGGGVMVYRSFANSNEIIFSPANKNIVLLNGATLIADPQKNGAQIVRLPKGASVKTYIYQAQDGAKICVNARADVSGAGGAIGISPAYSSGGYGGGVSVSTSWVESCNLNVTQNAVGPSTSLFSNLESPVIYLSYIKYSPAATTITPCSGKNC